MRQINLKNKTNKQENPTTSLFAPREQTWYFIFSNKYQDTVDIQ